MANPFSDGSTRRYDPGNVARGVNATARGVGSAYETASFYAGHPTMLVQDASGAVGRGVKAVGRGVGSVASGVAGVAANGARAAWHGAFYDYVPDVEGAARRLHDAKTAAAGQFAGQAEKDALARATKAYHQTVLDYKFENKELGASMKAARHRWFGTDMNKLVSDHVPDNVFKHSEAVLKKEVSLAERIASKPFRSPIVGLGAAALATLGIGAWLSNRAEERTRSEAMAQIAEAQMRQPMPNPYMNSVTPDEAALLNARMRDSSANGRSHADAVATARAAAANPAPTA